MTVFEKWLDTFIEEKGIDLEENTFEIEHNGELHLVESGFVVELIKKASKPEQATIKNQLVRIDFVNAPVIPYLKHLATCYIKTNF